MVVVVVAVVVVLVVWSWTNLIFPAKFPLLYLHDQHFSRYVYEDTFSAKVFLSESCVRLE